MTYSSVSINTTHIYIYIYSICEYELHNSVQSHIDFAFFVFLSPRRARTLRKWQIFPIPIKRSMNAQYYSYLSIDFLGRKKKGVKGKGKKKEREGKFPFCDCR